MKRIVITTLVFGLCTITVVWSYLTVRSNAVADQCSVNLRNIGIALHYYHDTYDTFPAAYQTDSAGVPFHSWRIRVLPFLKQNGIFDAYRFDEPWNSDHNLSLAKNPLKKVPDKPGPGPLDCLLCPLECDELCREGLTSYAMIVGPGTAFPTGLGRRIDEFPDGVANTIIVAEIDHDRMHWLEPRDLDVERMSFRINDPAQPSISSQHPQGPALLFGDAKVFRVSIDVSPSLVKALITVDGGENVSRERLVNEGLLSSAPR